MILDEQDLDLLKSSWRFDRDGYLRRSVNRRVGAKSKKIKEHLHRIVARRIIGRDFEQWEQVDHINHNILDNRRCNIRVVDHKGNGQNRSGGYGKSCYLGVALHKCGKWQAQIKVTKTLYLGLFPTQEEAAMAYNNAAEKYGFLSRNIIPSIKGKGDV